MKQDKGLTAKDTVMSDNFVEVKYNCTSTRNASHYCLVKAIAQQQAEITWDKAKAHYEQQIQEVRKEQMEQIIWGAGNIADYNHKSIILRFLQALKGGN